MTTHPSGAPIFTAQDAARARERKTQAKAQRGALLALAATGRLTLPDAIRAAKNNPRLARIRLDHLLEATGHTPSQTRRIIQGIITDTNTDTTPGRLNIAWLTDPRAKGVRILALAIRLAPATDTPWDGYPLKPPPEGYEPYNRMEQAWKNR